MKLRFLILVTVLIIAGLLSAEIPPETILAEHSNGKITMEDFNQRLSKIPVMYQGRYQNYEGKVQFLNDLVTEEVFYQEAISLGLENDPNILKKAEQQIKSTYYTEYQNYLKNTEVQITDDELNEYFLQNLDEYPGITFDEAKTMVEKQFRPQKEKEFIEKYNEELWQKYDLIIREELLDSLDFNDISTIEPIADQKYITSNTPELEKTIADLKEFYDGLPNMNKRPFLNPESLLNTVREITKMDLYYLEARAAGFDDNPVVLETMPMIIRNLMLRETYNRLVTEKLEVNDKTIRDFYDENIEKFSTKAYRKIQAFGFKDDPEAQKAKADVKKAVKKDNADLLNSVLENSVFEFENGEIDYIYKNNIIPKCGKDTIWCDLVWKEKYGKTSPKKLSDIFLSAQNYYVFFRVLEDIVPIPTAYEEVKVKIENEMRKDKSKVLFEEADRQLKEKFKAVVFAENLVEKLTAEEYFVNATTAQEKRRYKDAIYYYEQICEYYPNGTDDYKAMFMKGFLYSEELKDPKKAISIFEELLQKYPQGELHDSAQFMIEELKGNSNILEKME